MKKSLIIFLYFTWNCVYAQTDSDSVRMNYIKSALKSIEIFQSEYLIQRWTFRQLSTEFCYLKDRNDGMSRDLLNLVVGESFIPANLKQMFLNYNFKCFSDEEKRLIKPWLNRNLVPSDIYYHNIVSNFKLTSEIPYLINHSTDSLFLIIKEDALDGAINEWNLNQLRNLATLYNLGYRKDEDWFLAEINDLYKYFSKSEKFQKFRLHIFYLDILSNSISLLNSKKAVLSTLYLLDETEKSPSELANYDDVGSTSYSFQYYLFCIEPKLKPYSEINIRIIDETDFKVNKDKIKELILHDNSIWLDYIKIENK